MSDNGDESAVPEELLSATAILQQTARTQTADAKRNFYARLRNERERATFSMMMRMTPAALTAIKKGIFH